MPHTHLTESQNRNTFRNTLWNFKNSTSTFSPYKKFHKIPQNSTKVPCLHLDIFFGKNIFFFWIFISLDPAVSKRSIAGSDDQKYASHISECKI